jgi:cytochrome c553
MDSRVARRQRLLVAACVALAAVSVASDSGTGKPRIRFDALTHDFGEIRSDQKVEHLWVFHNDGDAPLEIVQLLTSCGCTMTVLDSKVVAPRAGGTIKVVFDPAGQQGSVRKSLSVVSNDPDGGRTLLTVKAFVRPVDTAQVSSGGHPPFTGQSLLMGPCASCHAEPSRGKHGAELYAAICAMCHGAEGTGGRAPTLRDPGYLEGNSDDRLVEAIAFGTANPRMPGFSELMGGPLSEEQIRSVVQLLRHWGPAGGSTAGPPSPGG